MEAGRLPTDRPINLKDLEDNGVVTGIRHGVKLLARDVGEAPFALKGLQLEVTRASAAAKQKARAESWAERAEKEALCVAHLLLSSQPPVSGWRKNGCASPHPRPDRCPPGLGCQNRSRSSGAR